MPGTRRSESTRPKTATDVDSRQDLKRALLDLQRSAGDLVDRARLQLALQNLREAPGEESIRIAVLGLRLPSLNNEAPHTAGKLLRLMLADPLRPEQAWEEHLVRNDAPAAIVRVDADAANGENPVEFVHEDAIPTTTVFSPGLDGNGIEFVLGSWSGPAGSLDDAQHAAADESPLSAKCTVVHKAIVVSDGFTGAYHLASRPLLQPALKAVNFRSSTFSPLDMAGCDILPIDVDKAAEGLRLIREDIGNAKQYQTLWSEASVGALMEWVKRGALSVDAGTTKPPVRELIGSLLAQARTQIDAKETSMAKPSLLPSPDAVERLNMGLSEWAQSAHQELQEQLDLAFTESRWRKLGWWKLFWRVDDVGMLSSEMLAQRFLPDAERAMIYFAGRMREAGIVRKSVILGSTQWPDHIPRCRDDLLWASVPALQALAQKLVFQSASTSGLTAALGTLMYLSGCGLYESGAVAALGLVWSLRRLQQKWENARQYWEGEVREHGRKAVRTTEDSVAEALAHSLDRTMLDPGHALVRQLIQKAEEALARLK